MLRIILAVLAPISLYAVTITKGPSLSDLGHSSARLLWQTDAVSSSIVLWDTVSRPGGCTYPCGYATATTAVTLDGVVTNGRAHTHFISGAPPNTVIYYRVCSNDGSGAVCSGESNFTTLPMPSPHPSEPALPTSSVDTRLPEVGSTHAIAADCSNLISQFTAANEGDWLLIPAGNNCNQNAPYVFPASSKKIVIATSAYDALPPPGTRVDPEAYADMMPRVYGNTFPLMATATSANCHPGSFAWDATVGGSWKMKHCEDSGTPITITSVTLGAGPFAHYYRLGVANSALFTANMVVRLAGVPGIPGAIGGGRVDSIPDSTHIIVGMYNTIGNHTFSACSTNCGTVERAVWTTVPNTPTSGAPTGACTSGAWAWDTATSIAYRCAGTAWYAIKRIVTDTLSLATTAAPVFDLETNAVSNVRFVGLRVGYVPVPTDPYFGRFGPQGIPRGYGLASPLITIGPNSNNIIFDRCELATVWPLPSNYLLQSTGNSIAVVDSVVSASPPVVNAEDRGYGGFAGPNLDNFAAATFVFSSGGPILLRNNWLEGYGITVHFDDGWGYIGPSPHDITITQNSFFRNPKYFFGSGASNGFYTPSRQLLEFKTGIRAHIDGNTFDGNWKNVSSGLAVLIRALGSGNFTPVNVDSGGNISMLVPGKRSFGPIATGNWLYLPFNDTLYQVTSTNDGEHIQAAGMPANIYGDLQWADSVHGTSDFTLTNNTFVRVPNGIELIATGDQNPPGYSGIKLQRVKISNNIFSGMRDDLFVDPSPWNSSGGGWFVGLAMGTTDVTIDHNTMHVVKGQGACGQGIFLFEPKTHEGLRMENNIVHTANPEPIIGRCSIIGTAQLNATFSSYTVRKNIFANTTPLPASYPSPNHWASVTDAPWIYPAAMDFTLTGLWRAENACYGTPGDCTTDGKDAGVDMLALRDAQSGVTRDRSSGMSGATGTRNAKIR